ncbi:MAG: hypothetical protein NEHIOOID_00048 [Holosporales bacterium]
MNNHRIVRYVLWGLSALFLIAISFKINDLFRPIAKTHNELGQNITALKIGGPFSLTNQFGQTVKNTDSDGKIRILYFGYTYCPDLCPMALDHITQALDLLKNDRDKVATYFITIDPDRDTVAVLKQYSTNFHKSIQMLTGSYKDLEPVLKAYKIVHQKIQDPKMSDYLMDHSTFIYILNPKGDVVDVMPHTTPGEKIAQAIHQQLFYTKR